MGQDITLVVDDASVDVEPPIPAGLVQIGRIVHWNHTPSFTEVVRLSQRGVHR